MIRLIVKTYEGYPDGTVTTRYNTFEVNAPEVEDFLQDFARYRERVVVGAECVVEANGAENVQ